MKVTLVGFKHVDFKPKDGGENVKGTNIFFTHLDDDVTGLMADKKFIRNPDVITVNLKDFVGKPIDIEVNLKGKVQCVSAV